jgi:hypothetical protein
MQEMFWFGPIRLDVAEPSLIHSKKIREYVCVSITDPGIGVRLDEICTSKLLSVT